MKKIMLLHDYKGRFLSKYFGEIYRAGMDKDLLRQQFEKHGFQTELLSLCDPQLIKKTKDYPVIYTSQEDSDYRYKDFIEDIVLDLESNGVMTLPKYLYLRANNNKVFMEMLRHRVLPEKYQLKTQWYGTAEDALSDIKSVKYPVVIKSAGGATSSGVRLAKEEKEYVAKIKELSRSTSIKYELRDWMRFFKHKGYERESLHRKKFIVQDFVPELENDWKVLVYHDKYYVLRRDNRPGDFRASGSGLFSYDENLDTAILEAAKEIKGIFDVPMISLDLAISDGQIILIEFQFLYFGTSTLEKSTFYYAETQNGWKKVYEKPFLEREYARSIAEYLKEKE